MKPRVLLVHTFYQQPGGEDQVFRAEKSILAEAGCEVTEFTAHNDALEGLGNAALLKTTLWNSHIYKSLRSVIQQHKPQVMHVHNTFPLMSPAVYHAAKAEGVKVVQTLHNFRFFCANATAFRDNHVCLECADKFFPWPAVQHACYRVSKPASATIATMLAGHRVIGSYDKIDRFIALTEFAKTQFVRSGIPEQKIMVKPNFVYPDPGMGRGDGGFALFVGRLDYGKGLSTLLEAWKNLAGVLPLKIIGDGEMAPVVAQASQQMAEVEWLGLRPRAEVLQLMQKATCLVFPALWYEQFPLTIAEAFAAGLPVIASNHGAMASLIRHQETGLLFEVGNPAQLSEQVRWLLNNPAQNAHMRQAARLEFEQKYTALINLKQLLEIYQSLITR